MDAATRPSSPPPEAGGPGATAATDATARDATTTAPADASAQAAMDGNTTPAEATRLDRVMDRLDEWQRERRWIAFPFGVVKKFGDDQAGNLAALVAYYAFFSIFPLLLLLTTVLGRVLGSNPELRDDLLDSALGQLPVIGDQLRDNAEGIPGSGLALVIGALLALWAGLGALMAMQNAMDAVWGVPLRRRPNFVMSRLKALLLLGLLGLGVAGLFAVGGMINALAEVPGVGAVLSIAATAALGTGLFLLAFRVLTDVPVRWNDLLPGAIVAALAWAALQSLGAAFVTRQIDGASSTAGVFAVVIGLLSWLYLQAQFTVLAAEVNVVRAEHLWPRSLTGRHLGDGDRRALARSAGRERRVEGQEVIVDLGPPAVDEYVRTTAPPDVPSTT
jgi:membrane protein